MKLIQLSDLHLTTAGRSLHGRDPQQQLYAAIADINTHHRDAALMGISGDLSDDGSADSYAILAAALSELLAIMLDSLDSGHVAGQLCATRLQETTRRARKVSVAVPASSPDAHWSAVPG